MALYINVLMYSEQLRAVSLPQSLGGCPGEPYSIIWEKRGTIHGNSTYLIHHQCPLASLHMTSAIHAHCLLTESLAAF